MLVPDQDVKCISYCRSRSKNFENLVLLLNTHSLSDLCKIQKKDKKVQKQTIMPLFPDNCILPVFPRPLCVYFMQTLAGQRLNILNIAFIAEEYSQHDFGKKEKLHGSV